MKKYHLLLLTLLSGILLSLAWPARGFSPLLLFSFVPLLFVEDYLLNHREKFNRFAGFFYSYPSFFIWNLLTSWWIYYASDVGMALAIILNSFMMAIVFNLFHITRTHSYIKNQGYIALIAYWMAFEYIHLNWELSWTWLNLGNGFANNVQWIQWYEYTGTFGGTLWILIVNIIVFHFIKAIISKQYRIREKLIPSILAILIIIGPIIISLFIYHTYEEKEDPVDIVVVQPNIDPYNEQYSAPPSVVVSRILNLARAKTDTSVSFVICPESALQEYMWHSQMENYKSIDSIWHFLSNHPNVSFIVGLSSREFIPYGTEPTKAARKYHNTDRWYEEYNTSLFLDTSHQLQLYHKSKLVVGVENMPFTDLIKPIEELAINLGGTVGTLGLSKERKIFTHKKDSINVATVICFESIFGAFCTKFVRNGANLLFIITNDGWWKNTPGHKQHMSYARIRTIESRRSIARSANTGISALINQRGDILQQTLFWEPKVIRGILNSNSAITFYVRFGDYLGRVAAFTSILLLLITFSFMIIKRRNPLN
ncbi:apolipoprotein N-acyltransferase [Bacteroidota bacterium]